MSFILKKRLRLGLTHFVSRIHVDANPGRIPERPVRGRARVADSRPDLGPVDLLVPKHHLPRKRPLVGRFHSCCDRRRPGGAFPGLGQYLLAESQRQGQELLLQRDYGRGRHRDPVDRHGRLVHEREFRLAERVLLDRVHRPHLGGRAQVLRDGVDAPAQEHRRDVVDAVPPGVGICPERRRPSALADLFEIEITVGLRDLPFLPEQLLLHPVVVVAHIFSR